MVFMSFVPSNKDRNKCSATIKLYSTSFNRFSVNTNLIFRVTSEMGTVQYCVLLSYHAAFFENVPPVYQRTPEGRWTCSYMGNLATVDAESESARRNRSARLMWIFTRARHPLPRRYPISYLWLYVINLLMLLYCSCRPFYHVY
jgi:hypothetical protein